VTTAAVATATATVTIMVVVPIGTGEFTIGGRGLPVGTCPHGLHAEVGYAYYGDEDGDNGEITKQCFHH
jgi:hypothetical protein